MTVHTHAFGQEISLELGEYQDALRYASSVATIALVDNDA